MTSGARVVVDPGMRTSFEIRRDSPGSRRTGAPPRTRVGSVLDPHDQAIVGTVRRRPNRISRRPVSRVLWRGSIADMRTTTSALSRAALAAATSLTLSAALLGATAPAHADVVLDCGGG